uniref:GATOR complex protein NPRL3 n=1 Tax=Globodera rostochiensis TaxID=31243 RepID=A0A914I9J7_GLORO
MVHSLSATPTLTDRRVPLEHSTRHSAYHHQCHQHHLSTSSSSSASATPFGVILVSKDESAERVLFMYPFEPRLPPSGVTKCEDKDVPVKAKLVTGVVRELSAGDQQQTNNALDGSIGLPVKMLAPLLVANKKIAIAINTEQQRCNYLRDQICLMQPSHDEYEALPDELKKGRCPYETILEKSGLAKHLRDIFEDVCEYGMVDVFVDDCIEVGFCVEPKALCHAGLAPRSSAEVEATMRHIRPYHGLLFLDESIPSPDANPFVHRFLDEYEPSRSFEEMSHLSGLPIGQVLQIVRHYLLWARAMLIYPICTTNVYANAPQQPHNFRTLEAQFSDRFDTECPMAEVLEAFSPPCSLGTFLQDMTIYAGQPMLHMSLMVFLLRNQLLVQLHTFFFLVPPPSDHPDQQQQQQQSQTTKNGTEPQQQNVSSTELSSRICSSVSASRGLNAALKSHVLDICARDVHAVGVPEAEVFWLLDNFLTLVPFLDGRHHMEDIIYRTRLDRPTIMRILDTFADILCPFYCQDIVIDAE